MKILLVNDDKSIRITRIDIKFDYFMPYKYMCKRFLDEFKLSNVILNKDKDVSTVYFGSRQSDIYCRFYNKREESNLEFDVSRLEFEIKGYVCKQFSLRFSNISEYDAMDYLLNMIFEFCEHRNIVFLRLPYFDDYVSAELVDKASLVAKFKRFCVQYKNSIETYIEHFGLTPNEFVDVVTIDDSFERYIQAPLDSEVASFMGVSSDD